MQEHNKAILYLIGAALLWSMGGVLIKWIDWNPMAIAGTRSLIALGVIFIYSRRNDITFSFVQIAGGLAYAATVILFVLANKMTTAVNAILLQYTAPVYVAIFGTWFLKEKITKVDWAATLLVLCGMVLFFMDKLSTGNMLGNMIAILSGVSFAWVALLLRKQKSASPIASIIIGNAITVLVASPFMFSSMPSAGSWVGLLLLGVFQLGISYIFYSKAIKNVTAIEAILIPVIEPILNPVWVLIILGEIPGYWSVAGGIVVLSSITLRSVLLARKHLART